jgi:chromosome partitioning protein
MILLIGGEKGGSGKSCLSQNLAVYLQQQGRDVLLIDADPQATSADWAEERSNNPNLKSVTCTQLSGRLDEQVLDFSRRYQDIVIDAGGQDSKALRSAMLVATHMLLPFRPKRRDLKTLEHAADLLDQAKMVNPKLNARAIITQCPTLPSQANRIIESKAVCSAFGIPALNAITMQRNIYDDADENGLSVLDSLTDEKAKSEIFEIAKEFLEL